MIFLVMMLLPAIFLFERREIENEEKKKAHNKRKVEAEADY